MQKAALPLVVFAVLGSACVGSHPYYPGVGYSTSPAAAVANVAVAGVLYVAAGGCKIAGCPTNTKCNVVSERCDPVKCAKTDCNPDEVCEESTGRCLPAKLGSVTTVSSSSTTTPAVPAPLPANPGQQ